MFCRPLILGFLFKSLNPMYHLKYLQMNAGNWIGWWRPKNQFGVDLEINHSMVQMISFSSFIWFRVDSEAILIVINTQYPAFHGDHVRLRFFINLYMWLMPRSESHYSWQVTFWGLWRMDGPELKHFLLKMMNGDLNLPYFTKQQHKKLCKVCQLVNIS